MGRDLLLIEPDPVIAETVRRAFAPAGFDVDIVAAGEPALDRCRASRPDLVLLSAELPDMSGFSVCNRIKRSVPGIPVMLYTGEDADAAVEAHRLTRTRADEYVRAPLDVGTVVARAAQLIASAVAAAGGPELIAVVETPIRDELLPEWPQEPSPDRGEAPDELEFLRERVRAKDAFLTRVKEAMIAQRAEAAELRERAEALRRHAADAERARVELERTLGEARTALDDAGARRADLEQRLADSEATRQALSDVLNETMQHAETSERDWSQRVGVAEQARVQLDGQLARAREERDAVARELTRLQAQLDQQIASLEEQRNAAATAVTIATEERDEARRRADAIQAELRDERRRVEQATAEIQARTSDVARLEGELGAARRRASELETALASREAEIASAVADAAARTQSVSDGAAEVERRRQAELARHKEALVDLERRLEASARAEATARRRIAELERERADGTAQGDRLPALEHALARTREELDDLRTENDFLNGEVARYAQKNRDLLAQLSRS